MTEAMLQDLIERTAELSTIEGSNVGPFTAEVAKVLGIKAQAAVDDVPVEWEPLKVMIKRLSDCAKSSLTLTGPGTSPDYEYRANMATSDTGSISSDWGEDATVGEKTWQTGIGATIDRADANTVTGCLNKADPGTTAFTALYTEAKKQAKAVYDKYRASTVANDDHAFMG